MRTSKRLAALCAALLASVATASPAVHEYIRQYAEAQAVIAAGGCSATQACSALSVSTTSASTFGANVTAQSTGGALLTVQKTGGTNTIKLDASVLAISMAVGSAHSSFLNVTNIRAGGASGSSGSLTLGYGKDAAGNLDYDLYNATSGSRTGVQVLGSFAPASGSLSAAGVQLAPVVNGVSSGSFTSLAIAPVTNTWTGGTQYLLDMGTTSSSYFSGFTRKFAVESTGKPFLDTTDSSASPGAVTINKPSGKAAVASAASSVVVTNSTVSTSSSVFITPLTNDANCSNFKAVPASGSFTVTCGGAAGADWKFVFLVVN